MRLNNAGKYSNITLEILVMLQNMSENCVRNVKEEKHRQLRIFIILWKSESQKTVHTPKKIAGRKCAQRIISFSTIEHFQDIIETNFA